MWSKFEEIQALQSHSPPDNMVLSFFRMDLLEAFEGVNAVRVVDKSGREIIKDVDPDCIDLNEISKANEELDKKLQIALKQVEVLKLEISDLRTNLEEQVIKTDKLLCMYKSAKEKVEGSKEIGIQIDDTGDKAKSMETANMKSRNQEIYPKEIKENITYDRRQAPKRNINIKKVLILADEQGTGLRNMLQNFLGATYQVSALIQPGAKLIKVMETRYIEELCKDFGEEDFVIILAGCNDGCLGEVLAHIYQCLFAINGKTKVIIGEVPYNKALDRVTLNTEIEKICSKFKNVFYVNMDYSSSRATAKTRLLPNLIRRLLKVIIACDYRI